MKLAPSPLIYPGVGGVIGGLGLLAGAEILTASARQSKSFLEEQRIFVVETVCGEELVVSCSIVKRMRVYMTERRRHEWQESVAIMGPEQRPVDVTEAEPALIVAIAVGEVREYSWKGVFS